MKNIVKIILVFISIVCFCSILIGIINDTDKSTIRGKAVYGLKTISPNEMSTPKQDIQFEIKSIIDLFDSELSKQPKGLTYYTIDLVNVNISSDICEYIEDVYENNGWYKAACMTGSIYDSGKLIKITTLKLYNGKKY